MPSQYAQLTEIIEFLGVITWAALYTKNILLFLCPLSYLLLTQPLGSWIKKHITISK